jgi:hypothetical protein
VPCDLLQEYLQSFHAHHDLVRIVAIPVSKHLFWGDGWDYAHRVHELKNAKEPLEVSVPSVNWAHWVLTQL